MTFTRKKTPRTQSAQWLHDHMKSIQSQPDGSKLIKFRVKGETVQKTISRDSWLVALSDSTKMSDLRASVVCSLKAEGVKGNV